MDSRVGVVVFFDLVGYSRSDIPAQQQLGQGFMQALRAMLIELYPGMTPQRSADCPYLILPTGDGAAIVLWQAAPTHPRVELTGIWLGGRMLTWAQQQRPAIGIRCGLNAGLLEFVDDPYGDRNVCGMAINDAQRIMDAAQEGQMLVHADQVGRRLYSAEADQLPTLRYHLHTDVHEILVKHGKTLHVQSITGTFRGSGPDQPFGKAEEPASKWHLQITPPHTEFNAYGIAIKRPFPEMLVERQRLAFVGATNDQLPTVFQAALTAHPEKRWQRITCFFLADDALQWIRSDGRAQDVLIAAKHQAREALEQVLRERVYEFECREYRWPYFFGAFFDWEEPGGKIHVSPYIWGLNVRECPGLDYEWLTHKPTDAYMYYRRGLEALTREPWSQPLTARAR